MAGLLFGRKTEKGVIGIDLGENECQISCMNTDGTTRDGEDSGQYTVPMVLAKRRNVNQWFFGREALRQSDTGECILVDNLVQAACNGDILTVDGVNYESSRLLALFMKKCLGMLASGNESIIPEVMVITHRNMRDSTVLALEKVVEILNLKNTAVYFQSHVECFYNYLLSQPEYLRRENAALFVMEGSLRGCVLSFNHRTTPVVAYSEYVDYPSFVMPVYFGGMLSEEKKKQLDDRFLMIAREVLGGRPIASVYLVGEGFEGEWMQESLRYICNGRRVFMGNNLFSKGAARGGLEKRKASEIASNTIFLGKEKLKSNVGVFLQDRGEREYMPLLDAGINWYEAHFEGDLYLESGQSFSITITPLTNYSGENTEKKYPVQTKEVVLDGLPERPAGTTRLHISARMENVEVLEITTKDLGFGSLMAAEPKVWVTKIALE